MASAAPTAPAAPTAAPDIDLDTPARWVMVPVVKDYKRGQGPVTNFREELTCDEYLDRKCVRWTGPNKNNRSYSKPEVGDNFLWVTDYDTPDGVYVGQIVGNAEPRGHWGDDFKNASLHDTFEIQVWGRMKWEPFRAVMGYRQPNPSLAGRAAKGFRVQGTTRTGKDKPKVALDDARLSITRA